jgi:hypothetical protein
MAPFGALSIFEEAVTMRVAFGLVLGTMLLAGSAQAAGPFDGSWAGDVTAASMGRGAVCPAATLKGTVTDGKLDIVYSDGKYTFKLRGGIQPDGTLAQGVLGNNPVTGKFTGSEFTASYVSTGCEGKPRQMTMHKTG